MTKCNVTRVKDKMCIYVYFISESVYEQLNDINILHVQ